MFKSITTHEKYYAIVYQDDSRRVVRRDTYYDTGWKSPEEIGLIEQIEAQLEYHCTPNMEEK